MRFRQILFWLHLLAGVIAGVVIFIMSATGVALAFEKEIIAWVERDVRRVSPPTPDAPRLGLDELLAKLQEERPGERPSAIALDVDPHSAVLVSFGRKNSAYVNPYTGDIREQGAPKTRAFMHVMIDWHRYLGGHDQRRALGKAVTGACNAAFLFLAASGLYLWWPRQWTKSALRAVGLMNFKLRGKPRDWNWHNAVGLWCAPILIVLTATALPISYRWAGDLIYQLTGTTPPAQGGPGGATAANVEISTPVADAKPLSMEALFAVARQEFPNWKQITHRAGGSGGRNQRNEPAAARSDTNIVNEVRERKPEGNTIQPVTLAVVEHNQWPKFGSTQLTLHPFTGAVLRKEGFSDFNLGRQVRSWTRFLHTGEALGVVGKALAGLASAGALLLVWTGFALSWRRFIGRRTTPEATQSPQ